jgi:cholestenol delta-isomerase
MEAVTAFCWGPLCLALFPAVLGRRAWRHAGVALVSLGQIYGDVLYFGTCLHGEGAGKAGWRAFGAHSRPEPLYFWFYFVAINAVWIVVPGMCLVYAVRRINAAVAR